MATPGVSPSQTIGPFFSNCLLRADAPGSVLIGPETVGERIRVEGHVYDGDGAAVTDALIEIWQADDRGRYHQPAARPTKASGAAFTGFGRCGTDEAGRYWFETIKPGRVPVNWSAHTVPRASPDGAVPQDIVDGGLQAPHVLVTVFARGLLNHLVTRLYFEDEPDTLADPVLRHVPEARRQTLIARRDLAGGTRVYRFDIVLQGPGETAFFNV